MATEYARAAENAAAPRGELVLTATGLTKAFGGLQVVSGFDLQIRRGEILALIGPNGAGKTTVFNLLCGSLPLDAGRVEFGGRPISGLSQHRIARLGIGRMYQDLRLFDALSVRDNVAVYCQAESSLSLARAVLRPLSQVRAERVVAGEVARVLDRFGLGALAAARADQISYAHRKLVALARLFASRSRLLLLDEPASGLDESEQAMIVAAIRGLAADGLTVCIVEHNMDLVRALADRVYFLAQGKVLADGTPNEVFEASHLAEIYFGAA